MYRSRRVFGNRSGEIARKRLKLLLVADKTNCSPEFLEMIKDDLFLVISKYLDIDRGDMEVGLTKAFCGSEQIPALYASLSVDGSILIGHFIAVI